MEWVTVRNPRTGNTARVPRSALPQMPKWREVLPESARRPRRTTRTARTAARTSRSSRNTPNAATQVLAEEPKEK